MATAITLFKVTQGHQFWYQSKADIRLPITVLINSNLLLVLYYYCSNLLPILHRFQVMVQFSLARRECLTLTLSLGVTFCQYRRK